MVLLCEPFIVSVWQQAKYFQQIGYIKLEMARCVFALIRCEEKIDRFEVGPLAKYFHLRNQVLVDFFCYCTIKVVKVVVKIILMLICFKEIYRVDRGTCSKCFCNT